MIIVVLAAGKSTRFKSSKHKALHDLLGKKIIQRVSQALEKLNPAKTIYVLGHQLNEVRAELKNKEDFVEQKEQLGTGHALLTALEGIYQKSPEKLQGILVTCVDTPLLTSQTLEKLIESTKTNKAKIGLLTTQINNPNDYGRIIRDGQKVKAIVEEKDASESQKVIKEINAGVYYFDLPIEEVLQGLKSLKNNNQQKEYYLTDMIEWANQAGHTVTALCAEDSSEVLGINNRADLAEAIEQMSQRRIKELQSEGVTFVNPNSTLVAPEAVIGQDTIVYPNCIILGNTEIGSNCTVGPNSFLQDSKVGNNSSIKYSHLLEAKIGNNCSVGPFANLRPGTKLLDEASVGDFVEIKNTTIASGSKVPHLSYIGDAEINEEVNIGAGTITANYNAITGEKGKTIIGKGVKVGSNSVLVAPVKIADGCMVAAGTVVAEDVYDKDSLIIARNELRVKKGWVKEKSKNLSSNT
ncbi:MAG: bifunctional UDP-N-acetylglucosamine diphosphorylase/glucosamine-1-phosphate N-acetyltransferase GlmU [Candidatus Caenarcaniphilales bacterium]|nr:bifunctional UDP-N-acetylglucosamine diphosphorylase/glucosamine-1-phosphate N-acetyltransferase GlmU [Candidatus Caenarcaniphilales bacterium]